MTSARLTLSILADNRLIGELAYKPESDDFTFQYSPDWFRNGGFVLSPHIRSSAPPQAGVVTRFLENLLPEGEGLRSLAQTLRVNSSNLYKLIEAIGSETTGALTISRSQEPTKSTFREIKNEELALRISERRERSVIVWDGKPRLSVAGVQEKLPIIIKNNVFGLGDGDYASTNILKFGNERTRHLVLNEYFCMKLARASGLAVAGCELLNFQERVLNVTRFDRKWVSDSKVARHHTIDGCQALDLSPKMKYERFMGDEEHVQDITGPATLKNIYDFCLQTIVPAKTRLDILHWVVFNLLIGNSDCHIKNLSFFVDTDHIRLAPFYDLVSVAMYNDLEQSLAFHIGDTFISTEVNAYNLAEMASELGLNKTFVAAQVAKVVASVSKALQEVQIEGLSRDEGEFLEELRKEIKNRCLFYSGQAPIIPEFESL